MARSSPLQGVGGGHASAQRFIRYTLAKGHPERKGAVGDYGEGSGEERPRGKRQPTNTDLTALFGASAASREPAVALATASVTIQASWVRAQRAGSLRLRQQPQALPFQSVLSFFFIFLLSALVGHVWVCSRGFARGLGVCFWGLSFGHTPKLGVIRCVPIIQKEFLWHSNGGATAPPKAHSDYNFLPQFSFNLCTLRLRFITWASKQEPCQII